MVGTGKTYTLMAALNYVAEEVAKRETDVDVTFFEIYGKKCFDLLQV